MYMQITSICNMTCDHCGFSCGRKGKHMDSKTWEQALYFAGQYDEHVSIGGGEPTLHPEFFDILKVCLDKFEYIWLASNGSKKESMLRLSSIIDNEDMSYLYDNSDIEQEQDEDEDDFMERCDNLLYDQAIFNHDHKLSVALSLDHYHDPISSVIEQLWKRRAESKHSGYEIRNVTLSQSGLSNNGRAKRNGIAYSDHCVCSDVIIRPNGKLKLCGCERSPIIGDVWSGISDKYQKLMEKDGYKDSRCFRGLKTRSLRS